MSRRKITLEEFKNRSYIIHEDKYDYSKFEYVNAITPSIIICKKHNIEFLQSSNAHLSGKGCKKCGFEATKNARTSNSKEFIEKSKKVHNNFYSYKKTNYVNALKKLIITCPIHSDFLSSPTHHLSGSGCPECKKIKLSKYHGNNALGWSYTDWEITALKSKHFDSFKIYIIECYNNNERFIKIGRTFKTLKKRFPGKTSMPYNFNVLKIIIFMDAREACEKESYLKNIIKDYKYTPLKDFGGKHECFGEKIKNKILNIIIN